MRKSQQKPWFAAAVEFEMGDTWANELARELEMEETAAIMLNGKPEAAACNFLYKGLLMLSHQVFCSPAECWLIHLCIYFSAGTPFGENSVVTVMIVPGSWHSTDDDGFNEQAELEGKC